MTWDELFFQGKVLGHSMLSQEAEVGNSLLLEMGGRGEVVVTLNEKREAWNFSITKPGN